MEFRPPSRLDTGLLGLLRAEPCHPGRTLGPTPRPTPPGGVRFGSPQRWVEDQNEGVGFQQLRRPSDRTCR